MKKILNYFPENPKHNAMIAGPGLILSIASFPAATEWPVFYAVGVVLSVVTVLATIRFIIQWGKKAGL